ncbi:hypothetical protein G9464_15595 [Halostella sp. JP-L12]|uniref:hypothetical protein n=1 Tax=Halostella TaxID=1843185 RepID=UPI000EF7B424|nr:MULTISPECIES: hypothetical protein [Halostella]NHN49007.1 hypothetical protein [Halostella sp. JP-L12]
MPDIEIPEFDYEEGENGTVVVTYTAENTTDSEQADTITVNVRAGQDNYERASEVTIPAGDTVEKSESFEQVTVDEFRDDGSIDFDWSGS